jgi:hypothetical protein
MIAALGCAFLPTRSRSAIAISGEEPIPDAGPAQVSKVVEHRLPGWEVARQVAPGAARA